MSHILFLFFFFSLELCFLTWDVKQEDREGERCLNYKIRSLFAVLSIGQSVGEELVSTD